MERGFGEDTAVMDIISNGNNKKLREVEKLLSKASYRKTEQKFVIEGLKTFLELDISEIECVFLSESIYGRLETAEYRDRLKRLKHYIVRDDIFKQISDTKTPQGICIIAKQKKYDLEDLLHTSSSLILLEHLQDPGNLGTIFRTALSAGIDAVIMDKETVDIYNPKIVRSALGAISKLPFVYVEDIKEVLPQLKARGFYTYAASLQAKIFYDEADFTKKSAIVIGNESNGLSKALTDVSDEGIKLPMHNGMESLNAAVATSILVYELERQRRRL